jgi:hypothetical protein
LLCRRQNVANLLTQVGSLLNNKEIFEVHALFTVVITQYFLESVAMLRQLVLETVGQPL